EAVTRRVPITMIPYYAWAHRGATRMAVWIAAEPEAVRYPGPTVTASHCNPSDTVSAVMDGLEPSSSNDHSIPRFTWWDHRGREEWIACAFPTPRPVSLVEVYWFDDTGTGQCRVPTAWRVEYRE